MTSQEDITKSNFWDTRIKHAIKFKKYWSDKFKTDALVKYYEGFHWQENNNLDPGNQESTKYVINLFFSSIETKVPSLLFQNPIFHVKPKPRAISADPESAYASASAREDVINDWSTDENNHVGEVVEAAIYDAFPRFGIVELGYSADWISNPYANKPAYKDDFTVIDGNTVIGGVLKVPRNEKLYIKHIPARNFYMSIPDLPITEQNDWCGYFEYHKVLDLRNNKDLINTDRIQGGFISAADDDKQGNERNVERYAGVQYEKVWTIYDIREKRKFLWAEGASCRISKKTKFKHLPLVDIRFKRRIDGGWYPLPITFNWISPQNELNEVREANKMHRRRFKRVYQVRPGAMDPDAKENFQSGPDGTIVETKADITAVPNADLGSSATQGLIGSKDDFNVISATSSEERGTGDRTTATAAAITNNKAQIRESRERIVVANFLKRIGRLAILLIEENFVNPIHTFSSAPQDSGFLDQGVQDRPQTSIINPLTDFKDDQEFTVDIEVDSMSPVVNDAEAEKFFKFIDTLARYPYFAISPILVRELAYKVGYRNEKVIKEFQQMALIQAHGMAQQQAQGGEQGGDPSTLQKQMTPPSGPQVKNQLQGQGIPLH